MSPPLLLSGGWSTEGVCTARPSLMLVAVNVWVPSVAVPEQVPLAFEETPTGPVAANCVSGTARTAASGSLVCCDLTQLFFRGGVSVAFAVMLHEMLECVTAPSTGGAAALAEPTPKAASVPRARAPAAAAVANFRIILTSPIVRRVRYGGLDTRSHHTASFCNGIGEFGFPPAGTVTGRPSHVHHFMGTSSRSVTPCSGSREAWFQHHVSWTVTVAISGLSDPGAQPERLPCRLRNAMRLHWSRTVGCGVERCTTCGARGTLADPQGAVRDLRRGWSQPGSDHACGQ